MWFVYLLECADGSFYCGITTDPARRLAQHNGLRSGGARCTRARRPVTPLACAPCADRSSAARLECRLRALPRERKLPFLLSLPGAREALSLCSAGDRHGRSRSFRFFN